MPVILVGNKTDQTGDRMVSIEEGQRRFRDLTCVCFHEISVRESVDQVGGIFIKFLIRICSMCKSNRFRQCFAMYFAFGVSSASFPN